MTEFDTNGATGGAAGGRGLSPEMLRTRLPEGFGISDAMRFIERRMDAEQSSHLISRLDHDPVLASWLLGARADRDAVEQASRHDEPISSPKPGSLVAAALERVHRESELEWDLDESETVDPVRDQAGGERSAGDGEELILDFELGQTFEAPVEPLQFTTVQSKRTLGASVWAGGLIAAAAVLAVGFGLGSWLGGGRDDSRTLAMNVVPESSRLDGQPQRDGRSRQSEIEPRAGDVLSGAPESFAETESPESIRSDAFDAIASSVIEELAARQVREEDQDLQILSDMPGLASSDSETTSVPEAAGGSTPGRAAASPKQRRAVEILPAEAARLAEQGLLEIVIERDASQRRMPRIERHRAMTADGVTIASLNSSDATLAEARRSALERLEDEQREFRNEPFVYLVDLEPTSRRLERLRDQLAEQTRGRVRFRQADRPIVPSIRAETWLWTGERVDILGRARFPLFIVIDR